MIASECRAQHASVWSVVKSLKLVSAFKGRPRSKSVPGEEERRRRDLGRACGHSFTHEIRSTSISSQSGTSSDGDSGTRMGSVTSQEGRERIRIIGHFHLAMAVVFMIMGRCSIFAESMGENDEYAGFRPPGHDVELLLNYGQPLLAFLSVLPGTNSLGLST